jgi:hypothetical protein
MNKKLFIVCPFSGMELFLQKRYGKDIFFMTASAAVIPSEDVVFLEAIREFIKREKINTIYIVNDTSCLFINNIVHKIKLVGLQSEKVIEDVFIDNYLSGFKGLSSYNQQEKLAELNVTYQAHEAMMFNVFGKEIVENDIIIKGLVTTKREYKLREIEINSIKNRQIPKNQTVGSHTWHHHILCKN